MLPAQLAALLLPLLPVADDPQLALVFQSDAIEFHVSGPQTECLGGVILSLSPELRVYFQGLPPLLGDFAVLGVGLVQNGEYAVGLAQAAIPPGLLIHAQGVIADADGVRSSSVAHFVLDGSAPVQR